MSFDARPDVPIGVRPRSIFPPISSPEACAARSQRGVSRWFAEGKAMAQRETSGGSRGSGASCARSAGAAGRSGGWSPGAIAVPWAAHCWSCAWPARQYGGRHLAGQARRIRGLAPGAGDSPRHDAHAGPPPAILGLIGLAYLVRESMNVLRRYPRREHLHADRQRHVRSPCRPPDEGRPLDPGAGPGRGLARPDHPELSRGSSGSSGSASSTSCPALLTGAFALIRRPLEAALGRAGDGRRVPISLALTIWQLITQKGIRLDLLRTREAMDGTVVEQLSGIDYVRAANTHRREIRRVARTAERQRSKELRHHFEMSLFGCGKALNEGFFHLLVLAFAVYLFIHGRIDFGDILTFSMLFLNVMAP